MKQPLHNHFGFSRSTYLACKSKISRLHYSVVVFREQFLYLFHLIFFIWMLPKNSFSAWSNFFFAFEFIQGPASVASSKTIIFATVKSILSDGTVNFEVVDVTENKKKDLTEKFSLAQSNTVCYNKSGSEVSTVNLEHSTSGSFYEDHTTRTKLNEKNACV